jgi:hypothetical protein
MAHNPDEYYRFIIDTELYENQISGDERSAELEVNVGPSLPSVVRPPTPE